MGGRPPLPTGPPFLRHGTKGRDAGRRRAIWREVVTQIAPGMERARMAAGFWRWPVLGLEPVTPCLSSIFGRGDAPPTSPLFPAQSAFPRQDSGCFRGGASDRLCVYCASRRPTERELAAASRSSLRTPRAAATDLAPARLTLTAFPALTSTGGFGPTGSTDTAPWVALTVVTRSSGRSGREHRPAHGCRRRMRRPPRLARSSWV